MVIIDEATKLHNIKVFRHVYGQCIDRDELEKTLIGMFIHIMENEEFSDKKKMDLVVLSHEIAWFDPAVMTEGLENYLIARH